MDKITPLINMATIEYRANKIIQTVAELYLQEQVAGNHMKAGFTKAMLNSYSDNIIEMLEDEDLPTYLHLASEYLDKLEEKIEKARAITEKEMFIDYQQTMAKRVFNHENYQKAFYTLYEFATQYEDATIDEMLELAMLHGFEEAEADFLIQHVACEMGYMKHYTPEELYDRLYKPKEEEE